MSGMNLNDLPQALLQHPAPARPVATPPDLLVEWAASDADVREAQSLRYQVFGLEMGARLGPQAAQGLDVDVFDAYCEHLLVRNAKDRQVIGTYRVLTPASAKRAGGYYTETEFDLTRLRALRPRLLEVGRSCVHADHRQGGVILALWGALAEFMGANGFESMVGCASVGMRDGGHYAASLWLQLAAEHQAPIEHRVRARLPLPMHALRQDLRVEPPALLRGYLRCGAKLLSEPAWDPDFGVADFPLLLRAADMPSRFRRLALTGPHQTCR
jgi:putative hemolysin